MKPFIALKPLFMTVTEKEKTNPNAIIPTDGKMRDAKTSL